MLFSTSLSRQFGRFDSSFNSIKTLVVKTLTSETLAMNPTELRKDFPILQTKVHGSKPLVYFDNGASTQRPTSVLKAMDDCYSQSYSNVHRGSHELSLKASDLYDNAREKVRALINAERASEVIFTSGTTLSINLVAHSFGEKFLNAGDEILITEMEHHSNIVPWQQLAERKSLTLKFLPFDENGQLRLDLLGDFLTEKTKLLAFTSMSNVFGTINPAKKLVAKAHQVGAKVLIDAAQSVPHGVTDVRDLDVDFLVFSGHKMLGPSGVGVLYGKESLLEEMPPFLGGGSMITSVTTDGFTPGELPAKFEAGTPPIVPAIGLGAAIDYLNETGLEYIFQHERDLTRAAMGHLEKIESVRILGPAVDDRGGIVSFAIDGVNSLDFATMIDLKGIAIRNGHHCAMPLHQKLGLSESNRASFYLYNTLEEISFFAEQVEKTIKMLR